MTNYGLSQSEIHLRLDKLAEEARELVEPSREDDE